MTNKKDLLFGFQKNKQSNITSKELEALEALASDLLKLSTIALELAKAKQILLEVKETI